ncbi:MAG TPA: YCF48-related protein [Candidatus Acidoferrum sp.]|nr:YCF48-related protein [Candidatus Acidoferrum sp.]
MRQAILITGLMLLLVIIACSGEKTIGPSTPIIHLSSDSLHFIANAGGGSTQATTQYVLVTNAGSGELQYTVSFKSQWLVAFTSGKAPDSIVVDVLPQGVLAGLHIDTIVVTCASAKNSPQRIIVTFSALGAMDVEPRKLFFRMATNGPLPADQLLVVNNVGGGVLHFSGLASSARWTFTPSSGLAPDTITVNVDAVGLVSGVYGDSIVFSSEDAANSPISVACSLKVAPWVQQPIDPQYSLRAVKFVDANHGWAVGFLPNFPSPQGAIFETIDGGLHWDLLNPLYDGCLLGGVDFLNSQFGCVVGYRADSGLVLTTTDGGAHWGQQWVDGSPKLWKVQLVTSDTGWGVGQGSGIVIRTIDGGSTWTKQIVPTSIPLGGLFFTNSSNGWVVGNGGVMLHTSDGGAHWDSTGLNVNNDLWGVTFADANHGWIVGKDGLIYATANGGTTWSPQTSPTSNELRGVTFSSLTSGWAVGYLGTIIHTENGGVTWQVQQSGTPAWLFETAFASDHRGWIVGDSSTVLTTYSGGK